MKYPGLNAIEQVAMYHLMIEEVEDYAILMLDPAGNIVSWNRGAEKIKGYREEEVLGKHFSIFYPQTDREARLPDKLIAAAATEGKATHEGWRVRKDGTKFWGSIVITAIHNVEKAVIGFTKVTRDLTERKVTEDRLLQYARRLESQNAELQQFAYGAAHDLKEPLRKIMMYYSAISGEGLESLSEKQRRYLSRSAEAARRMHGLIDDMLAFTRVTHLGHVMEPVDLNLVVTEVIGSLKETIDEAAADIKVERLPTIPGIPFQMNQLFANLLGNSLKYRDPRRHLQIDISSRTEDIWDGKSRQRGFQVTVRDNGIGFDPMQHDRIFNLFERLHGRQDFEGTGIGLAICRKIMETHHGSISASGETGVGAVFELQFPAT
jgi:PAS domain S-box-containing protein